MLNMKGFPSKQNIYLKNYFDYAASCPPFPESIQEYGRVAQTFFGNPFSIHEPGKKAKDLLIGAKHEISSLLGFPEGYLVLTSGGTESNNLVIRGIMEKNPNGRLLLAADSHASCWFATETYKNRVDVLPVDKKGAIDESVLNKMLTPDTILCSVLHGNNETGFIHNVEGIGRICADKHVLFLCDGVQMPGHVKVNLGKIPFDFYTFSSHKFGGPRGCGGVFAKKTKFTPQINGGGQELNLRSGTENVAGLCASLTALQIGLPMLQEEETRLRLLAEHFVQAIGDAISDVVIHSNIKRGIPGLVSLSFPGLKGSDLVTELNLKGFSTSYGSACHSGEIIPSRVILSRGIPDKIALGTIRISMGRYTDEKQVDALLEALKNVVNRYHSLK